MSVKKQKSPGSRRNKSLFSKPQLYLQCSVIIRQESSQYSSWCPELDIASCGSTIEVARQNLHDAISSYLQTYAELGELSQLLKERGLKLVKAEEPPSPIFLSGTRIDVPFSANSKDISLVSA